ncbi:MAG: hypothetical protein DRQ78_04045 [Epsilonproteobacteria bacterium]|nr:MAG: hypothetical protein DRQ78_04045 [Campylobacterota bacterium]
MKKMILIILILTPLIHASFSRSNGIVTDNRSNLQWQDDYSDNNNTLKTSTWQGAIDYCEALTLNGHLDWRLPNINELQTLVDYGQYNPSLSSVFINQTPTRYWSSSTAAKNDSFSFSLSFPENAWIIDFFEGHSQRYFKNFDNYVRCIRQ